MSEERDKRLEEYSYRVWEAVHTPGRVSKEIIFEAIRGQWERAERAEAENEALRAEALRHAGECARHAADDRAVIADLKVEVQQAKDEGERRLMARENETDELIKAAERERDEARAERDRLRESRDGMLREAVRALEHWLAKGAKVVWTPYLTPSACRELLRAAGFYGDDQLEHARAALASGESRPEEVERD